MNVIVANTKSNDLSNLDIDVIKNLNGEYSVSELVEMFKSFFYGKMILDVTAIKDYGDLSTYEELSKGLSVDRIIFLLPEGSKLCTPNFLSHLIDLGIYNFTTDMNGVKYLLKKTNTLNDVEHIKKMVNERPTDVEMEEVKEEVSSTNEELPKNIIKTTTMTNDGVTIIGFKNVTEHAGSTTLIYMLKKELTRSYGSDGVIAVELNKSDFAYFRDKNCISIKENDIKTTIANNAGVKIILVDLNNAVDDSYCNEVIYLIEPTTIKLNKLIQRNRIIFSSLTGKTVLLNKSALLNNDVSDFEGEAGIKVFYNMPSLDERKRNEIIGDFLTKLGLLNNNSNNNSGGIFGLFRR
ncbi:MAG: hypothetical protein J6W64_06110 [Bacilli bacterium]|nr:hypothetical protein [Bacilli bacterium]